MTCPEHIRCSELLSIAWMRCGGRKAAILCIYIGGLEFKVATRECASNLRGSE